MVRSYSWILVSLLMLGCGSEGAKGLPKKFVPLSGVITLNDKPLDGAVVQFSPDQSITKDAGAGAFGVTDTAGKYSLKYRGEQEGVPPGTYKVTVSRLSKPDGAPIGPTESAADVAAVESLPPHYSSLDQTSLNVVVSEAGGSQDFKLVTRKK